MDIKEMLYKPGIKEKIEEYRELKRRVKEDWGKDGSDHYYRALDRALEHSLKQKAIELAGMIVGAVIEEIS